MATLLMFALATLAVPQPIHASAIQAEGSSSDFLSLARAIVEVAADQARKAADTGHACGPLLVDVQSFVAAARQTLGEEIPPEALRQAIGRPYIELSREEAIECEPEGYPCAIWSNGVFIRLDSLQPSPTGFDVRFTALYTDRRSPGHSAIGGRELLVYFARENGRWIVRGFGPGRVS